jgi:hypothetical protein
MADFLSRLAARALGLAPTARPNIASMFALRPTQAGSNPLESWLESESLDASVPQGGISMQKDPLGFSHAMSPSPSLVPQGDLSPVLPEQPPGSSEGASTNTKIKTAHSQHTVFDAVTSERTEPVPSPLVTRHTNLIISVPEAHSTFREEVVSMYPDQSSENPMPSAEYTSFHSERRVAGGQVGVLKSRPIRPGHPGNDKVPLSQAPQSYEIASVHPQGTLIQHGSRSSRHDDGFNNPINEAVVIQERSTVMQSAHLLNVEPSHNPGAQAIALPHPVVSKTYLPAALPQRTITPEVIHSQPITNNGQRAEAQVIEVSSPEPTIQVTIGRIEVRATPLPPAQPQSQQRSAPSIMSLDQYLQQRSKGGDR